MRFLGWSCGRSVARRKSRNLRLKHTLGAKDTLCLFTECLAVLAELLLCNLSSRPKRTGVCRMSGTANCDMLSQFAVPSTSIPAPGDPPLLLSRVGGGGWQTPVRFGLELCSVCFFRKFLDFFPQISPLRASRKAVFLKIGELIVWLKWSSPGSENIVAWPGGSPKEVCVITRWAFCG